MDYRLVNLAGLLRDRDEIEPIAGISGGPLDRVVSAENPLEYRVVLDEAALRRVVAVTR